MKKKLLKVSMLSIISITGMLSFAPYVDAKNTNTKDIYLATTNIPNKNNPKDTQQQDITTNDMIDDIQEITKGIKDKKTSTKPKDKVQEKM